MTGRTMDDGPDIGESLRRLVTALAAPVVGVEDISTLPDAGPRRCYRLRFADGRCLKGRRFSSAARAAMAWRILTDTPTRFLRRPVSHDGDAMLEEWIEGEVLVEGRVAEGRIREAGRALGALHTSRLPAHGPDGQLRDASGWQQKTVESLRLLTEEGLVTAERAHTWCSVLDRQMPAAARFGIVHRDLCPENLAIDTDGYLTSIDNGSVTCGLIDHDLCRLWYRWPMNATEREAFFAGYREHAPAPVPDRPSLFWMIVVVVNSARSRLAVRGAADAALRRLDD